MIVCTEFSEIWPHQRMFISSVQGGDLSLRSLFVLFVGIKGAIRMPFLLLLFFFKSARQGVPALMKLSGWAGINQIKTQIKESNLEKEQSWRYHAPWLQTILQNYGN